MTNATIGLAGTFLGAILALLGTAVSDRRQRRSEERRWRRDQMAHAYEQTLRYLMRAAYRRSGVDLSRRIAVLSVEHHREWFDDFAEARLWLNILTSRCGSEQLNALRAAAARLDREFNPSSGAEQPEPEFVLDAMRRIDDAAFIHLSSHGSADRPGDMRSTTKALQETVEVVLDCARRDLGNAPASADPQLRH